MAQSTTLKIKNSKSFNPMLWIAIGYMFLFIVRPFEIWIWLGELHIERLYMIGALICLILWHRRGLVLHKITYTIIIFLAVLYLSAFTAFRTDSALDMAWEYSKLVVFYFVMVMAVRDEKDFRTLLIAFIAIMGFYIGKSLWEFYFHGRYEYRQGIKRLIGIDSTSGDPNTFASTILYSLPFAMALFKVEMNKRIRLGLVFYFLMSIYAIILTGSRAGMLCLLFLLLILLVQSRRKIMLGIRIALFVLLLFLVMPNMYQARFKTIFIEDMNPVATVSGKARIAGLEMGFRLFEMRPILGWGAGNFMHARNFLNLKGDIYKEEQAHNLYGQIAADLGIIGIVTFFLFVFTVLLTKRKIRIRLERAGIKKNNLIYAVASACSVTVWLHLFQGNFGHNLYRYSWIWVAGILTLADLPLGRHAKLKA
jgi:O-antigen ligase